jgi:hypothetical protein
MQACSLRVCSFLITQRESRCSCLLGTTLAEWSNGPVSGEHVHNLCHRVEAPNVLHCYGLGLQLQHCER